MISCCVICGRSFEMLEAQSNEPYMVCCLCEDPYLDPKIVQQYQEKEEKN